MLTVIEQKLFPQNVSLFDSAPTEQLAYNTSETV